MKKILLLLLFSCIPAIAQTPAYSCSGSTLMTQWLANIGPTSTGCSAPSWIATTTSVTAITPLKATSASIGGTAIALGACLTNAVTISGIAFPSTFAVVVTPAADPNSGIAVGNFWWTGVITAANTVTVKVCSTTAIAATPTSTTYNVRVIP